MKLYGIPLQYWTKDGFSRIASFLGVPLYAIELTVLASRISFARICIVKDVDGEFSEKFIVETGFGNKFEVKVEYNWT